MQHWNLLLSWNSETVQIFSKLTHILQGLLKPIHKSKQSHLLSTLNKNGYTNLFWPPKINVWKSQAVFCWHRQAGCSYVFGGKKFMRGQTNTLLLFIHWFHPGYEPIKWRAHCLTEVFQVPNSGDQKCQNGFLKIKDQKRHSPENA